MFLNESYIIMFRFDTTYLNHDLLKINEFLFDLINLIKLMRLIRAEACLEEEAGHSPSLT